MNDIENINHTEPETMTNGQQATTAPTATAATINPIPGELLTLAEVAAILKVSRKTLYAWKAQGKIRFVKVAGCLIRIPRTELAAFIAASPSA